MQPPSWLYGLQDYFDFTDDFIAKLFVDQLISVYFSENKANSVKNLCLSDAGDPSEKLSRFNFYFKLLEDEPIDFVETVSVMRKRLPDVEILDIFHKYGRKGYDMTALADAFSRGQVQSKIWLANELANAKKEYNLDDFPTVFLFAGWFGQLVRYLDNVGIGYQRVRNFDIDPTACEVSDYVFNIHKIKDYEVKSSEIDINNLDTLWKTGLEFPIKNYKTEKVFNEKRFPSIVINTSAEHFDESWYHKIVAKDFPNNPLFVIQSNNLHEIEEHINTVHSINEMKKKFPMDIIYYEGELELPGYKRFMLIGRP